MYSYIKNVFWLPKPNKVELYFTDSIPPIEKVAAVFVYVFNSDGELLLANDRKDRWNIPGGGRDEGESVIDTAIRETVEEACVKIKNVKIVAHQRLLVDGKPPQDYRRPYPEAYEVFVSAIVDEELPFKESDEMIARKYFSIENAIKEDGILFENRRVILDKILE
tara:strand:+ start:55472 stop:55966 length:495 start_codon:yes stop_codon:yes gene_type:complete